MQIETPQAVAIYCRLSKEDLDENKIDNLSRSIQNQKSMLTDFAEINGWQIFDIYCDDNLSGVARDRPEFNRLIRDELLRRELKARKEAGAHNLHEQKKNFPPGIFGKEVRCASCGKILTKGKTLRKTGYERTLFCPTRKKSPSHCKGAFISEKHLESAILHELKNLADRYSDDRVQIGICQDAQSADLIQERNRLKTAVELIEKEITAYEQRSRDLYLKRATDGMSIDDFNSALSRIRNDVDKLRLKSKRASSELLHLNESIAAESIRMETVLKAADFNHLDKTKVSMLIESVYVHKRDPKSGTQAIDITWKF